MHCACATWRCVSLLLQVAAKQTAAGCCSYPAPAAVSNNTRAAAMTAAVAQRDHSSRLQTGSSHSDSGPTAASGVPAAAVLLNGSSCACLHWCCQLAGNCQCDEYQPCRFARAATCSDASNMCVHCCCCCCCAQPLYGFGSRDPAKFLRVATHPELMYVLDPELSYHEVGVFLVISQYPLKGYKV
jgi:hypothetical protein